MNILCPEKSICIDDASALGNFSSELPDRELFRSLYFPNAIWDDDFDIWTACYGRCVSTISQADADLCAQNNAKICERQKQYGNTEITCYKVCPDGQTYDFTIPANTFFALSQAQANALASNWCSNFLNQLCDSIPGPNNPDPGPTPTRLLPTPRVVDCNDAMQVCVTCFEGGKCVTRKACTVQASTKAAANSRAQALSEEFLDLNVGCLTALPKSVCKWEAGDPDFNQWIVPSTVRGMVPPYRWEIYGSNIPPGIFFSPNASAMRVHGQWDVAGTYIFRLYLIDANDTFTYRTYTVSVMEIDEPAVLPNADQDQPYSHTISTQNGYDPKSYAVKLGSTLPCGLLLDAYTGTISGTPDCYGTFSFWITVSDRYGAVCQKEFTLTINPNIFSTIPWVLGAVSNPPGGATVGGGGYNVYFSIQNPAGGGGGGTARASFHPIDGNPWWTVNNPTGAPLNCSLTLTIVAIGSWPENGLACGQFESSSTAVFQQTNGVGVPIATIMNLLATGSGVYTANFTMPVGVSHWAGKFLSSAGAVGPCVPPAPQPYALRTWNVEFHVT